MVWNGVFTRAVIRAVCQLLHYVLEGTAMTNFLVQNVRQLMNEDVLYHTLGKPLSFVISYANENAFFVYGVRARLRSDDNR